MAEPKTSESFPSNSPPTPPRIQNGNGYGYGYGNGNGNGHVNGNGNTNGNGNRNGSSNNYTNGHANPPPLYTARPSPSTPRRSLGHSTKLLGAIDENGGMSPDIPVRNPRRVSSRSPNNNTSHYNPRAFLASLLPHSVSAPKDDYEDVTGPKGEKLSQVRENRKEYSAGGSSDETREIRRRKRDIVRRGGWKVWGCIALVLIIIAAMIAIGLVIGLKRINRNQSDDDTSNSTSTPPLTAFPIGSYAFTTYLISTAPSCTPNPATWRCYPYDTYSSSSTNSITSLDWIISGDNSSGTPVYTISSTDNIFTLPFSNVPLEMKNKGVDGQEYYAFSVVIEKIVYPDVDITADGSGRAARCYYNESMIEAKLYTQNKNTLPGAGEGNGVTESGSGGSGEWPGAIEYWQVAGTAPVCYEMVNGGDGAVITVDGMVTEGECSCLYRDFEG